MLSIDTTIDSKHLEIKLKEILFFDITQYAIINANLLSVDIKNKSIYGDEYLEILSMYGILLERNNRQEYYNVEIINYYSANCKPLDNCLKNSIRIY